MYCKTRFLLFSLLLVGLTIGCGSKVVHMQPHVSVKGKIMYNGKPIPDGEVSYILDGGAFIETCEISSDGTYEMRDMVVGAYTVVLFTGTEKPPTHVDPDGKGRGPAGEKGKNMKEMDPSKIPIEMKDVNDSKTGGQSSKGSRGSRDFVYTKIPEKYKKAETSDLKITLSEGVTIKDWELED
jgi:hypothetical protein